MNLTELYKPKSTKFDILNHIKNVAERVARDMNPLYREGLEQHSYMLRLSPLEDESAVSLRYRAESGRAYDNLIIVTNIEVHQSYETMSNRYRVSLTDGYAASEIMFEITRELLEYSRINEYQIIAQMIEQRVRQTYGPYVQIDLSLIQRRMR